MITLLGDVYALLPEEYHHKSIHRDWILNAVGDDPSCKLAYQKQASSVAEVIFDREASASAIDAPGSYLQTTAITKLSELDQMQYEDQTEASY